MRPSLCAVEGPLGVGPCRSSWLGLYRESSWFYSDLSTWARWHFLCGEQESQPVPRLRGVLGEQLSLGRSEGPGNLEQARIPTAARKHMFLRLSPTLVNLPELSLQQG